MFKKFFKWIATTASNIYNSRGFEFAAFAYESLVTTVDWVKSTITFVDTVKNVGYTLQILGKYAWLCIKEKINKHIDKVNSKRKVCKVVK